MRLVYLGSPDAAVAPLRALIDAGHEIVLVVSQPDRRRGRGAVLRPSPVKAAALALGLRVSDRLDDAFEAARDGAELGVVVAFGKLISPRLLEAMPFLNIHFSLLPRWRGAAPVERALLAGDSETGVCLMGLDTGLDTGPVYRRAVTPISPTESVAALRNRLVSIGTVLLVDSLTDGFVSLGVPQVQVGESTYAAKLDPAEFAIDWFRSADEIGRLVRLGEAWTTFRGKRFKILEAAVLTDAVECDAERLGTIDGTVVRTGAGTLRLLRVQPESKGPMAAAEWRNGAQLKPGERLGCDT